MNLIGNHIRAKFTRYDEYSAEKEKRHLEKYPMLFEIKKNLLKQLEEEARQMDS